MRRLTVVVRLFALLLLIGGSLATWPAPAYAAAALDATIGRDTATPAYPATLTFELAWSAPETVTIVELSYGPAEEAVVTLALPVFEPAASGSVAYVLDMQTNYAPPGLDFAWHWRLIGESGATFDTPVQTVLWRDTRFDWQAVGSDLVEVSTYAGDGAFARDVLEATEIARDAIEADLGLSVSSPVRIWVYDSKEDFAGTQAPNSEQWIAGVTYVELNLILAVVPHTSQNEITRIIQHEMAHVIIHQNVSNPFNNPPTWLDEGLAQIYQGVGQDSLERMVADAVDDGVLLSIRSLNGSFPYDPGMATLAYAESYSIVQFIRATWGDDALAALLLAYREGVTHDQAAMQALGVDLDELDRLWKQSLGYGGNAKAPTRLADTGDGGGGPAWLGWALASGSLVMGGVAALALVSAWKTLRRAREEMEEEDEPVAPTERPTGPSGDAW